MPSDGTSRLGLHPSIVLSAFVEPLVRGRRVAVLGDATIGFAEELAERGARLVHAYDPDSARAAEALARAPAGRTSPVSHAVLASDLGVRDGAFDLVVVPDLSIFPDPADLLRRARRLVAPTGAAVFVTPNPRREGKRLLAAKAGDPANERSPSYYELYDLASLQFAKVRMIGQAPFVGYTIADFAPAGEPEVSVDTSLLQSSEEPEHFIALASDRPVALEAYTVVELPFADVAAATTAEEAPAPRSSGPSSERLALTEAQARAAMLSAELERSREREATQAREAALAEDAHRALVEDLTQAAELLESRFKDTESRAGDSHVRAERLTLELRDLDEELRNQRDRSTRLTKQLEEEKKARTKAEVELGILRARPPEVPNAKERIEALTTDLEQARLRIAELTAEIERGRDRLVEMEAEQAETKRRADLAPPPPNPAQSHRIDELERALNAALQEAASNAAQRTTARERVAELEHQLAGAHAKSEGLAAAERTRSEQAEGHAAEALARVTAAEQRLVVERERVATGEQKLAAEQARADAAAQKAHDNDQRARELVRRLAAMEARESEAVAKLRAAERERAEGETKAKELSLRIARLEGDLAARGVEAGAAAAELSAARAAVAKAEAEKTAALESSIGDEINDYEAALRQRGQVVASLERALAESERIGRELLAELEARGTLGLDDVDSPADLRTRLDALATRAAHAEADLQASSWKIAKLERELADATGREPEPTAVQVELEQALRAARDEVASLRKALGS